MAHAELAELQKPKPRALKPIERRKVAQLSTLLDDLPDPNRLEMSCASTELFELIIASLWRCQMLDSDFFDFQLLDALLSAGVKFDKYHYDGDFYGLVGDLGFDVFPSKELGIYDVATYRDGDTVAEVRCDNVGEVITVLLEVLNVGT